MPRAPHRLVGLCVRLIAAPSLTLLVGCLPAPALIEGVKQLGGHIVDDAMKDDKKFMKNYSDEQVCLISTNRDYQWVAGKKIFVDEPNKREIKKECRRNIK